MSGYCDTGRVRIVISPAKTIRTAMTVANIGLFMKKLENTANYFKVDIQL